ncbi:MAG: YneF family protein [Bacilli bacterium]|nr:YneF family protein [Bacilli bacterium]
MTMSLGHEILLIAIGLVIGAVIGFFVSRLVMKKYLKKNPPINEQMIKIMMSQMGRTPTQKQINQMMKAMNNAK